MKKGSSKCLVLAVVVLLAVVAGVLAFVRFQLSATGDRVAPGAESGLGSAGARETTAASPSADGSVAKVSSDDAGVAAGVGKDVAADDGASQTDAERREAEDEKLVDAFDGLTDAWMNPARKGVTMKDVDAFVARFSKLPASRKQECLQRALNLIPDENVMLLAGILMDKSQPKAYVEMVFNDILNRDEDVKKPILQQVFKDKAHPCWADTAWILDVTGEKPQ